MGKTNYSVARIETYTKANITKAERHNERKNKSYSNMNVDLTQTPNNVHYKKCNSTYNERLKEMIDNGQVSLRGLKDKAKVVKKIFSLFIQGLNPSQIAKKFTTEGVMNPTEYYRSLGRKTQNSLTEVKHYWSARTITQILDRQEYIGDTINFRYSTRSFKDKTRINIPKEQWKIFKNTHEAIIDEKTWKQYRELEIINADLQKQESKVYFLVIYFAKIVELNYIIVLLITLQQIKTFIDVQIIKIILHILVLAII